MEARDLIVTPLLLIIVYATAYAIRPYCTDQITRKYFFPALTVRIVGALAVGFIYQFYYSGGDTFNFHTYGSRIIWEAFMDSPEKGLRLIFWGKGDDVIGIYQYSSRILFLRDSSSFTVIRIAALVDLFTFSSYSATAVIFAIWSFLGSWLMFRTFYTIREDLCKPIALATLFVPSVFFWGSGLLKDTLTLGALGVVVYYSYRVFVLKRINPLNVFVLVVGMIMIYFIKKYIVICFVPALLLWLSLKNIAKLNSVVFRILVSPIILSIGLVAGYVAVTQVGEQDERYSFSKIAETAKTTAYDIAYWTGRDAGSTYSLGELDGSFQSLLRLAPQAINVSLFRPYLWEVRNPLMLLSAVESFGILILTLWVIVRRFGNLGRIFFQSDVVFCFTFSLAFAFAVGVSTFNFGTLSRYKIPLVPFYLLALIFIYYHEKRDRKFSPLAATE